jgi:hypothetical protein
MHALLSDTPRRIRKIELNKVDLHPVSVPPLCTHEAFLTTTPQSNEKSKFSQFKQLMQHRPNARLPSRNHLLSTERNQILCAERANPTANGTESETVDTYQSFQIVSRFLNKLVIEHFALVKPLLDLKQPVVWCGAMWHK